MSPSQEHSVQMEKAKYASYQYEQSRRESDSAHQKTEERSSDDDRDVEGGPDSGPRYLYPDVVYVPYYQKRTVKSLLQKLRACFLFYFKVVTCFMIFMMIVGIVCGVGNPPKTYCRYGDKIEVMLPCKPSDTVVTEHAVSPVALWSGAPPPVVFGQLLTLNCSGLHQFDFLLGENGTGSGTGTGTSTCYKLNVSFLIRNMVQIDRFLDDGSPAITQVKVGVEVNRNYLFRCSATDRPVPWKFVAPISRCTTTKNIYFPITSTANDNALME